MRIVVRRWFYLLLALLTGIVACWQRVGVAGGAAQSWSCVAPIGERAVTAELPSPQTGATWIERFNRSLDAMKRRRPHLVVLGDSIVEWWPEDLWIRDAAKLGLAADRTQNLLWRLDHGLLEHAAEDAVIVVMIGTNNVASMWDTATTTARGVRAVLDKVRQVRPHAKVLLIGILPRGERPDDGLRVKAIEANALLRLCQERPGVMFADIGGVLLDADGVLPEAMAKDHLHPTRAGYARLSPALEAAIGAYAKRD
jgi:lysophospholipase L1-like esterase